MKYARVFVLAVFASTSLSACNKAGSQTANHAGSDPIANITREGRAFDVELNATNANPIYRLSPSKERKQTERCPFLTVSGKIACTSVTQLSVKGLSTEIVRYDVSHYLFAGGYGCESGFCFHDINDPYWLNESSVIDRAAKLAVSYLRVGRRGPHDAGILAFQESGRLKAVCFYPKFIEADFEKIVIACRRVAREG